MKKILWAKHKKSIKKNKTLQFWKKQNKQQILIKKSIDIYVNFEYFSKWRINIVIKKIAANNSV